MTTRCHIFALILSSVPLLAATSQADHEWDILLPADAQSSQASARLRLSHSHMARVWGEDLTPTQRRQQILNHITVSHHHVPCAISDFQALEPRGDARDFSMSISCEQGLTDHTHLSISSTLFASQRHHIPLLMRVLREKPGQHAEVLHTITFDQVHAVYSPTSPIKSARPSTGKPWWVVLALGLMVCGGVALFYRSARSSTTTR